MYQTLSADPNFLRFDERMYAMISNHDATLLCHPKKRNKTLDGIRVVLPRPVRDSFKTKKTKTKLHQGLGT